MTRFSEDLFVRNEREAELVKYADRLAKEMENNEEYYDETGKFPFEHSDQIMKTGDTICHFFMSYASPRKNTENFNNKYIIWLMRGTLYCTKSLKVVRIRFNL